MQNDLVIDIRGLSYQHPAGPGKPRGKSLDGIDLAIRAGEFVVITGPSGRPASLR
jgi:ABC-type lipoprotein export system ATPase subunit